MEPEFETELCDLKIEGGNQGDLFLQSGSNVNNTTISVDIYKEIEDGGEKRGLPVIREETAEEEMLVEDTEKVNILTIISSLQLLSLRRPSRAPQGAKMWEGGIGGGVMKNMGMAIGIIRSRNRTLMLSWRHSLP